MQIAQTSVHMQFFLRRVIIVTAIVIVTAWDGGGILPRSVFEPARLVSDPVWHLSQEPVVEQVRQQHDNG